MRRKANLSLILLALLFLIAAICVYRLPGQWWPRMLLYVSEAGLVGALADLFAITALFRHPLGLKILPHTAIIPKNRDKLVDGVVSMVEEQLLSKNMLKEKAQEYHLVELAISLVERKGDKEKILEQAWNFLVASLEKMELSGLAARLDKQVRGGLQRINLSPYAGRILKWVLDHSDYQAWFTQLADFAAERISHSDTKQQIREMLVQEKENMLNTGGSFSRWFKKQLVQIAESSNALNLDEAADVLYDDLQRFMLELRNPDHELRVLVADMLYKLAADLEERAELSQAVDAWKNELLEKISLLPSVNALLANLRNLLAPNAESPYVNADTRLNIRNFINRFIGGCWEWFKQDQEIKNWLEGYVQEFVQKIIETEHALVGQIVRTTLNEFTEQRLVEFIESKVDTDLQRIRLNGALVGAALGAVFYILLHGVYGPLLNLLNG
ncbi:DUF445 domain-containing protein [Paenibacillus caui]|uniref:DUF445 domain-containing protein n=1 Tax=Paenibacillus caui TaxID=2873927 RepID=UPI001F208906|nr:DUF445 domain-containing protein [Paenibacillus caui]